MALADSAGCARPGEDSAFPEIVELNVGGQVYITRRSTLVSVAGSLLWEMFAQRSAKALARDSKGRFFVDRDGFLFRYILDYMRDQQLVLPEHFPERGRLQREAEYFRLPELAKSLAPKLSKQNSFGDEPCQSDPEELSPGTDGSHTRRSGFITIGYRGSYTLGRDSQTDARFRRVARIMVCGKTCLAKEVFGETLNESRDPDRPPERYTSRYYLKFTFLEQAFDRLAHSGFHMVACSSTGTCAFAHEQADKIWTSYTEYVFYRENLGESQEIHCCRPAPARLGQVGTLVFLCSTSHCDFQWPPSPAGSLASLPWPDAPEECVPARPTTLDFAKPLKPLEEVKQMGQRRSSAHSGIKENGLESCPEVPCVSEEKRALQSELGKCIEDFQKIRIPVSFPSRKRQWQNELLKKYQL
uniref:BTB domain-containing protein n=1 Tax=Varanus komodoensis TaxID=61221 RepID=A0A8D2LY35_VARKO